jgi:LmbE family N-acetylglucosaminyl deacetylase
MRFVSSTTSHLVLSPHPDDAVLSLGGCISAWKRQGEATTVITVFDGPPRNGITPAAREDAARYEGDPVEIRRTEDRRAVNALGADLVPLGLPELVHRWRSNGTPRLGGLVDIYGPIEPDDEPVIEEVLEQVGPLVSGNIVHVPIGVGGHVDHRIVRAAAERLDIHLEYFEDLPYAIRENVHDNSVEWPPLANDDVDTWFRAIAMYESQMWNLFEGTDWQSQFKRWFSERETSS